VNEGEVGGLETVKRTGTAELRRRFEDITRLLGEGYNHKQICEHLNGQGLAIPYPQYRAIMTRLRREKGASGNRASELPSSINSLAMGAPLQVSVVPLIPLEKPQEKGTHETKISWDPMSKVKWK
jgi:hypothetical protein